MNITEKALVSCELVDGVMETEVSGPGEKILYLVVWLLAITASNLSEAEYMGMTDPEGIIKAVCATAICTLDKMGGSQDGK